MWHNIPAVNQGGVSGIAGVIMPIDAIQDFSSQTQSNAENGRNAGGVVNVVVKSGTNQIHGSAWEFNRLAAYTANTYANDVEGLPKGQYTRNQFGWDVGGPIKKDKLFFYQSSEFLRVRSAASLIGYVPDPAFLALPGLSPVGKGLVCQIRRPDTRSP